MKSGIEIIRNERKEQREKHGYDSAHDDQHINSEMVKFAVFCITGYDVHYPSNWDTSHKLKIFKKDRVDQLGIAGAMIAAEIDRLQRKKSLSEFEDLG